MRAAGAALLALGLLACAWVAAPAGPAAHAAPAGIAAAATAGPTVQPAATAPAGGAQPARRVDTGQLLLVALTCVLVIVFLYAAVRIYARMQRRGVRRGPPRRR